MFVNVYRKDIPERKAAPQACNRVSIGSLRRKQSNCDVFVLQQRLSCPGQHVTLLVIKMQSSLATNS
jgi:hypothetical protein